MNKLIDKIASYERATQSLLDKVVEYEDFIKANIPSEFWGEFGFGHFGPKQDGEHRCSADGKLIPYEVRKIASSIYWAGNYNYNYSYVTPKELINWCKGIPTLIAAATEYIDNITKEAETICEQIEIPS